MFMRNIGFTIKGKIRIAYGFILVVLCIVLLLTYNISKKTIKDNAVKSQMSALNIVAEKLNARIEYVLNLSDLIYNSSSVNQYINHMTVEEDFYEWHYSYVKLYGIMQDFTNALRREDRNLQIILFNEDQGVLYYSWAYNNPDKASIEEDITVSHKNGTRRYGILRENYGSPEKGNYLYFYNCYMGTSHDYKGLYVIIGIPEKDLNTQFQPLIENGNGVAILAENDEVIFSTADFPEKDGLKIANEAGYTWKENFSTAIEEGNRINLCTQLEGMDWKIIQSIRANGIFQGFQEWWQNSILCLIVLSLAVFIVLYYLNRSIVEPLEGLYKEMQKVKEGNKKLKVPAEFGKDEIGNLFRQFYDMVEQINLLEEEMITREKEKRKLEIETLQAQINPHFLYNTINAIKMLLRMRRIEEASTALTALVDILKSTLWYSNQTVTLEYEIQFLNSYIFIQKLRYDNFQFIINIPSDLREYAVMRFLIQPFIENCFLHGFDEINKDTVIEVTALEKDGHLEIWILDNGIGMTERTINKILTETNKRQGLNGIGIGNVIKRIHQNYGEKYHVDIYSTQKEGTKICLILPLIEQDSD